MSMLEVKIDGDDVGAVKTLEFAINLVKLLKEIEKGISKSPPSVKWRINIMSGYQYGLIQLWAADSQKKNLESHDLALSSMHSLREHLRRRNEAAQAPSG